MEYAVAAETDIGISRKSNQDAVCVKVARTEKGTVALALVCDGMGGLADGEVASASVVYGLSDWFEDTLPGELADGDLSDIVQSLQQMVIRLHERIYMFGKERGRNVGTTISCILFVEQEYAFVHAGDSRIYRLREELEQLTTDHTVVAREIAAGRMTQEEAKHSPDRSKLTQCLGVARRCELETGYGKVQRGDVFLLCSDGLRHRLTGEEMKSQMLGNGMRNEKAMKELCREMVDTVMRRGEKDNISVILLKGM